MPSLLGVARPEFSKRSVININDFAQFQYMFLNHVKQGTQWGPYSTDWATGTPWTQAIDLTTGYPNAAGAALISPTRRCGLGINFPESSDWNSYAVLWDGSGQIEFSAGPWTLNAAASTNVTETTTGTSTGRAWKNTNNALSSRAVFTYAGPRSLIAFLVTLSGIGGTTPINNIRIVRTGQDETDLGNGLIFRQGWKQLLVNLNPGAVRLMDWTGVTDMEDVRWENRKTPLSVVYSSQDKSHWHASGAAYGSTTGTNAIAIASVAGSPSVDTHGTIVTCRVTNATTKMAAYSNGNNINLTVNSITNAAGGGVVTTAVPHGYATGDKIIHYIPAANGMTTGGTPRLDRVVCTITVLSTTTYNTNVDTSGMTAFTGPVTLCAAPFISFTLGALSTRAVLFQDASTNAAAFGPGYIAAGDYKTFYYDKTVAGERNLAGAFVMGAWLFNDIYAQNGHNSGVPLEICTALINELNAMGPLSPINMWICIPHRALSSIDIADYSASSNWATNAVNTVLNGNTIGGVTYAGLTSVANLFVEYGNELVFSGARNANYLANRGTFRDPTTNNGDYVYMSTLRHTAVVKDVKAMFPGNPRLRFVIGGQGTAGTQVGSNNYYRMTGSSNYLSDAFTGGKAPDFDYFCYAAYIDPESDPTAGGGTSSANDSAKVASALSQWQSAGTNAASQEAAYLSYVNYLNYNATLAASAASTTAQSTLSFASVPASVLPGHWAYNLTTSTPMGNVSSTSPTVVTMQGTLGGNVAIGDTIIFAVQEGIFRYYNRLIIDYNAFLRNLGKTAIMYEGGWNHSITLNSFQGNVTSGSSTLTALSSTAGISVGDYLFGKGIPPRTRVRSINGVALSIVMEDKAAVLANATATGIAQSIIYSASPTQAFLLYCKYSQSFSDAMVAGFNAFNAQPNCGFPADYIQVSNRWGHCYPDVYGFTTAGVEGAGLDTFWLAMGARNRSLS